MVELVTSLAILALVAALLIPALSSIRARAMQTEDASTLRQLGSALLLYAQNNQGAIPKSFHSAGAHSQSGWARSIAPFLDSQFDPDRDDWENFFNTHYRSPFDEETNPFLFSYGLNVYFELNPNGDSYPGTPQQWNRLSRIPSPNQTIALARIRPVFFADHFMCHLWTTNQAPQNSVATDSHDRKSNILFLDGSVSRLAPEETFSTSKKINMWHPQPELAFP